MTLTQCPKLIYLYVYTITSRRLRWAGHVARMKEGRSAFKILTGKPKGKRPLGRLKLMGGQY